jgi:Bacterial archaeo-eukaryotic release factor family 2
MDTTRLTTVYAADGPFATVTLDVSHDNENAAREHVLRVRATVEELAGQGAPDAVIQSVTERLDEPATEPAPQARTVVAAPSGVLLDQVTHQRVDQSVVGWGPLPDLAGWVRLAQRNVRFVLALVDHVGGDVAVYQSDVPEPESETAAGGDTLHVHKVPVGGWSALRYQHETENVWKRNAEAVADEIGERIREGLRLILIAGDPRSKSEVLSRLEKAKATFVPLESGQRAEDSGDEALQQAIREALQEYAVARQVDLAHQLTDRLGRDFAVATGVRDVAGAFVQGQVETLLLDPEAAAQYELTLADHPGLSLGAVPGDLPLRADQAFVAAAVLTDADATVLPQTALGGAPVAALLRWDTAGG